MVAVTKDKQPTPKGECITADKLGKLINVDKVNKQLGNMVSTATGFLTSYKAKHSAISDDTASKAREQELDRYKQTASNEKRKIIDDQEKMISKLNQLLGLYKTQLQSAKNTEDLYKMLVAQNIELLGIIENEVNTIEISDRKTYYESEQNSSVGWWSNIFVSNYKYLIMILILAVLFKRRYTEIKLWGFIFALMLYPTLANYFVAFIKGIYNWILSDTKWVYLYSKM
jgi:hypothetical protein